MKVQLIGFAWTVFSLLLTFSCGAHGKEGEPKHCKRLYDDLYADDILEVLVVYGYKDARPNRFVGDRHERLTMVQKLVQPCHGDSKDLCGFSRKTDDSERFFKIVNFEDGQSLRVEVFLLASSRSPDDERNRKLAFQKHSSQFVQRNFLQGFDKYEVVLYNGHSRAGGGPDFFPPRLQKDMSVDYGYYKKKQPGFQDILKSIRWDSKVSVFGLFSCASSRYFRKKILKKKEDLTLVSSPNLLYYTDANQNMFATLKGLMSRKCEPEMNKMMNAGVPKIGSRIEFSK